MLQLNVSAYLLQNPLFMRFAEQSEMITSIGVAASA